MQLAIQNENHSPFAPENEYDRLQKSLLDLEKELRGKPVAGNQATKKEERKEDSQQTTAPKAPQTVSKV